MIAATGLAAGPISNRVKVTSSGTCSSGAVNVPVVDVPLSKIEVIFTSEAGPGVTTGQTFAA